MISHMLPYFFKATIYNFRCIPTTTCRTSPAPNPTAAAITLYYLIFALSTTNARRALPKTLSISSTATATTITTTTMATSNSIGNNNSYCLSALSLLWMQMSDYKCHSLSTKPIRSSGYNYSTIDIGNNSSRRGMRIAPASSLQQL